MVLSARLVPKQQQSLNLTPQLRQSLELLQLPTADLEAFVAAELESNPLLERAETDGGITDETEGPADAADAMQPENAFEAAGEAVDASAESLYPEAPSASAEFDLTVEDLGRSGPQSVYDYLEQLLLEFALPPDRHAMGLSLIGAMDEAGYLTEPLHLIAERLSVNATDLEAVRLLLADAAEPAGLLAVSVADCLAWQLKARNRFDPVMARALDHLALVARRDAIKLARMLGQKEEDAAEIIRDILALDPKPGLHFAPADLAVDQPPDVIVTQRPDGSFAVELNPDCLPRVLVNERYYKIARKSAKAQPDQTFLKQAHSRAGWLVRALDQRAQTILRIAAQIVALQDQYFRVGVSGLQPLTMQKLADQLQIHESTVSRAVNGKLLESSRGVQPMKFFFTAAIQGGGGSGDDISAEAVRARIRALIEAELPSKVLSDDKIASLLKAEGHGVARRTVAKYREAMEIPPSSVRKRHKKVAR